MKIVGLICEYNPLHNGHLYHINKVKELSKCDLLVVIMSSTFTMRGDLSIYDKFTKTKQALQSGIDIVLENPFIYTVERADIYASNSVDFLSLVGVNEIWIGSEENNVKLYEECYLKEKNITTNKTISYKVNSINDYPFKSNDLLGYFYYKRIKDLNYNIKLNTIKRIKSTYESTSLESSDIASSTAIRCNLDYLDKYTPLFVSADKNILDMNKLLSCLKYKILSTNKNELKEYFLVDEGIENSLVEKNNINSLDELIKSLSNKKYSNTRIKRMLLYILFNIKKNEVNSIYKNKIDFIRILGFNKNGQNYINQIKKEITIYTNIKEGINDIFDIEIKISKIIDSIYDTNLLKLEQKGPIMVI